MADLLDIMPATAVEAVHIGEQRFVVRCVNIPTMAAIIAQFPDLKSVASGNPDEFLPRLILGCGAAVGPIIAAGCGRFGDHEFEQRAANLLPEHVFKLMSAILRVTFPNGIGSFVAQVTALVGGASEGAKQPIQVRLKKSHLASQPSSEADSRPTMQ